jgi:pyruvate dehydrogenase E2 component (dihydrolipoamide acetyltransferase)
MHQFTMPSLGASMESGTVVEWKVQPGDRVERGDIVCEIETQKGNIDVEIWQAGRVDDILAQPGQKVPVGEPIALIDTEEEGEPVEEAESVEEVEPVKAAQPVAQPPRDGRIKASPAARKRAVELGVDLAEVPATGPGGAVTLGDVEGFGEPAAPARAPVEAPEHHVRISPVARKVAAELKVDPEKIAGTGDHGAVTRADVERAAAVKAPVDTDERPGAGGKYADDKYAELRRAIANAMERSKREIPHYYLEETIDMARAQQWLLARNAQRPPTERVIMAVLVARAIALAATQVPGINGVYDNGGFQPSEAVHLGFAVAMRGGGVVAPAVHDFADRELDALMADVRDVVRRVRGGKLRASELSDPTITVTNLGEQGVEKVYGVIYPPQVAIVGVGKLSERPWANDGMVGARPVATFTLSADHRVSDGITGAKFLRRIDDLLQHPETL